MRTMFAIAWAFWSAAAPERVQINDNRSPAGALRDGVLTLALEARDGEWHPTGDAAPGIVVRAFAERGKSPSVPGPMIRVPEGTDVRAAVRNTFTRPLTLYGLGPSVVRIEPGATTDIQFRAATAGTYFYRGVVSDSSEAGPTMDAELSGAIIVDPRGVTTPARDRVFVIALWSVKPLPGGIVAANSTLRFSINGRSWPHTERLAYDIGDTVRFRVINTSNAVHPMHLHGFYFDVNSRGTATADSVYDSSAPRYRVVTERAAAGRTFTMTWVPERAGNWLFHCHDNFHVLRNHPLDGSALPAEHLVHVTNHATDMMGGLVMGIEVRGREAPAVTLADAGRRHLSLTAQHAAGGTEAEPNYGYVLREGARTTSADSSLIPGPVILLKRGEPVAITVHNKLTEKTAVHWHGIELESYFDGVADFSGAGHRIAGAIAPNDSFVARFTPPRSGTFMYHPHADELRQQQAGMSGTLLVVDDPAVFDPVHDIVLLISVPRNVADQGSVLINGSLSPRPLELKAGERYRLRIVDIHTFRPNMIARVLRDSTSLSTWRALAKDGMDLPAVRATVRPAIQQMGNGETFDFELAPITPGELTFTVRSAAGALLATMAIHVR